MGEFDLIQRYFKTPQQRSDSVQLGIGDDAAICSLPPNQHLVCSVDTLITGVHFPEQTAPEDIAYKALAVNLSDFAAMGATPAWMTLALTCPRIDETWLQAFSQGLFELAQQHQVSLVGGDTTRGQLTISIQLMGWIPPHLALLRSGAQRGDKIVVSGSLGDAGLGLQLRHHPQLKTMLSQTQTDFVQQRLNRPTARLALGQALQGIAHAAIDVSDGLLADLGHILAASSDHHPEQQALGARINLADLPLSPALQRLPADQAWQLALNAGDDYELCFTLADSAINELYQRYPQQHLTCIGTIVAGKGITCIQADGQAYEIVQQGYQHFNL